MQETPPETPVFDKLTRNILASNPRVTKFKINWDNPNSQVSHFYQDSYTENQSFRLEKGWNRNFQMIFGNFSHCLQFRNQALFKGIVGYLLFIIIFLKSHKVKLRYEKESLKSLIEWSEKISYYFSFGILISYALE